MSGICCFTGHRKIEREYMIRLPDLLDRLLERLIERDVKVFRAGGAIGFDTVAALTVIEKKRKYPDVRLVLELPCRNQCEGWSESDKRVYDYVLRCADEIHYVSESYRKGCMMARNRKLVDGADFCVAYCAKVSGGSAYTLNYAAEKGVKSINLYDILAKN